MSQSKKSPKVVRSPKMLMQELFTNGRVHFQMDEKNDNSSKLTLEFLQHDNLEYDPDILGTLHALEDLDAELNNLADELNQIDNMPEE